MRRFIRTAPAFGALTLALAACGGEGELQRCGESSGDNTLDGSYCAVAEDLEFDRVRFVEAQGFALQITYGIDGEEFFSPRFRVSINLAGVTLGDDVNVPEQFLSAQRWTETSAGGGLPVELNASSNVTIDRYGGVGGEISGELDLLIDLTSNNQTQQRTLFGTFRGTVIDNESGL